MMLTNSRKHMYRRATAAVSYMEENAFFGVSAFCTILRESFQQKKMLYVLRIRHKI
jgi:hypothetical protein